MDEKLEEIKGLLNELFGDTSVSKDETAAALAEIADEIDIMLQSLESV